MSDLYIKKPFMASEMTLEELHKSGWIIYDVIRGSQAYGTSIEGSDVDKAGIYIQPTDQILRGDYIPQISDHNNDEVYYEIGRYLELLQTGNPNILELLNTPEDCIVYDSGDLDKYLPNKDLFITKQLRNTFVGYAETQIKKATGLNKKMNNPMPEERKDVLDFCYVIDGVKSYPFWYYYYNQCDTSRRNIIDRVLNTRSKKVEIPEDYDKQGAFDNELSKWGVSKVQNGDQLFGFYMNTNNSNYRGLLGSLDGSELRTSSIPKEVAEMDKPLLVYFNLHGFKQHCKAYKEYWSWVKKRK